jgi:hypothetical protein
MRPLRLSDLPDSPMSMPTPTQRKRFGMTGPVSPTRKNVPRDNSTVSPEEIREATFDARCQATSGYARAFYETEIADQQALIRRYQAELAVAQTAERRSATAMGAVLRAERSVG